MKPMQHFSAGITAQHGFTLVELIIVMVIIGVLVISASAKYRDLSEQAERTACFTNQMGLETAQTVYYTNAFINTGAGRYARSLGDLSPYLRENKPPVCPGGGDYQLLANGKVSCSFAEHSRNTQSGNTDNGNNGNNGNHYGQTGNNGNHYGNGNKNN